MAENKKSLWDIIYNPNYKINDFYGLVYLDLSDYYLLWAALSGLRKLNEIDSDCYHIVWYLFKHHYNNSIKIKKLNDAQPRFIAQKFIGKKNVRLFIFKRDGYACLKCGTKNNLTIDHIIPISIGGENLLFNLQTLCRSCNSIKKDTYKDYRNGAR